MKKSYILTLVSWLVVVLSLMLVGAANWWSQEIRVSSLEQNQFNNYIQAKEELFSLISKIGEFDSVHDFVESQNNSASEEDKKLDLKIEVENKLFNINVMPYEFVFYLLLALDIDMAQERAAAICAWRGDTESKNIPLAAFNYFAKGYSCKESNFESLEELELIKSMETLSDEKMRDLKRLLTVYGDGKINMNFIEEQLLSVFFNTVKAIYKLDFDSNKLAKDFVFKRQREKTFFRVFREFEQTIKDILSDNWTVEVQTAFRFMSPYLEFSSENLNFIVSDKSRDTNNIVIKILYNYGTGSIRYLGSVL